jgi:hypothetical protein
VKRLVEQKGSIQADKAASMTTAKTVHLFDYPRPAKPKAGEAAKRGPPEGQKLGAVFDREALSAELLRAIQLFARGALKNGNPPPILAPLASLAPSPHPSHIDDS